MVFRWISAVPGLFFPDRMTIAVSVVMDVEVSRGSGRSTGRFFRADVAAGEGARRIRGGSLARSLEP